MDDLYQGLKVMVIDDSKTIRRTAEGFEIVDEGSKNGTWLNGETLTGRTELKVGDSPETKSFTKYGT